VIDKLAALGPLAPLHQPHNLAPIRAIATSAPHMPQVACFDTAFHRSQPDLAQLYAIPKKFTEEGVRRYGFHGLSYEFISGRLGEIAVPALVLAGELDQVVPLASTLLVAERIPGATLITDPECGHTVRSSFRGYDDLVESFLAEAAG